MRGGEAGRRGTLHRGVVVETKVLLLVSMCRPGLVLYNCVCRRHANVNVSERSHGRTQKSGKHSLRQPQSICYPTAAARLSPAGARRCTSSAPRRGLNRRPDPRRWLSTTRGMLASPPLLCAPRPTTTRRAGRPASAAAVAGSASREWRRSRRRCSAATASAACRPCRSSSSRLRRLGGWGGWEGGWVNGAVSLLLLLVGMVWWGRGGRAGPRAVPETCGRLVGYWQGWEDVVGASQG